MHDLVMI